MVHPFTVRTSKSCYLTSIPHHTTTGVTCRAVAPVTPSTYRPTDTCFSENVAAPEALNAARLWPFTSRTWICSGAPSTGDTFSVGIANLATSHLCVTLIL